MKRFVFFLLLAALPVLGKNVAHPLLPADTSSPRATYQTFMENCERGYYLLQTVGRSSDDEKVILTVREVLRNLERCMDLSEAAEFRRVNMSKEAAVTLKEVFDRIEVPKLKDFPDVKKMTNDDGSLAESWTIPNTEITFRLVKEGPLKGTYQFSPNTVRRADEFYDRVKHLDYKKGATQGFINFYLTSPGSEWVGELVVHLPERMHVRKHGQAVWQWIGLGLIFILMVLIMVFLYFLGRRLSRKGPEGGMLRYVFALIFPILAALVPLNAQHLISKELVITGPLLYGLQFNLSLLTLFAGMVVILGIARRVGEVIASAPNVARHTIDAQLVRVFTRLIGFAAAMILLLQGGKHLGIPLSSLLAGAGVVGMALALSAQDLLKNVFGSIMLVMDKPFTVGERIKVRHYDGVVEEIGMRSTKIRLLNGHQAIVPNEDMAKTDIENIGRRPFIRRVSEIPLSTGISADQAKRAVELVEALLENHEGFNPDFPPRVWLNDFERDYLELKMIYWYHPPDYWAYTAHADKINRKVLETFEEAGIKISLPAFTTRIDDQSGQPVQPPQD